MPGRDAAERAQLLKIVFWLGGPMLVIGIMTIWFAAQRFDLPGPVVLLLVVGLLPATWGAILLVEHGTARASHGLVIALHAGHVASPETGFSRQEALVAQGRLEDAAVAYRLHLADHPHDIAALVALGRLLAGPLGDPDGAAAAYRAARQSSPGGDWDRIISNDLIDWYRRSKQEGKLQVELARFGEMHRGTTAGEAALAELRALKRRRE
ncbi:MAG TPA: hypothetical protein PKA66_08675 [Gemmatimonadales bacterium]|nr:hypothetical protein [Gemmatimonadales bacterium]